MRSFGLITQVPDRVMRWLGQSGEGLNEEGDSRNTIVGMVGQSEGRAKEAVAIGQISRPDQAISRGAGAATGGGSDGGGKPSGPKNSTK